MIQTSPANLLALLLALCFLPACQDSQDILASLDDPDFSLEIEVPAGFNFETAHKHAIQVIARKTNGYPMEGILFQVYSDDPASGGSIITKGITDESGSLQFKMELPEVHNQVFLSSTHPAWNSGRMIELDAEEVQSVWEWDLRDSSPPPTSGPATSGSSCGCPEGGREVPWPVGDAVYTVPAGSVQCISTSTVRSFEKFVVEGSLYITGNAIVKFPGDTLHVAQGGRIEVCPEAGLSLQTSVTTLEGDIFLDGWIEACKANIVRYTSLSMGDGAILSHFGNQLFLPEDGVQYHGAEKDAHIFFGGLAFNGTLSGTTCPRLDTGIKWEIFGGSEQYIEPDIICFSYCRDCEGLSGLSCGNGSTMNLHRSYNQEEVVILPDEICGNGIDDDGNGLVDCEDGACSTSTVCQIVDSDDDHVKDEEDDFPQDASLAFSTFTPNKNGAYTYAFESGWPEQGDYDFNDLVVDITYEYLRNSVGMIEKLIIHSTVRGIGSKEKVAFGMSLDDLAATQIESVEGNNSPSISAAYNGLEALQEHPVVILFDDAHALMGSSSGKEINSGSEESLSLDPVKLSVSLSFKSPLESVGVFNPFIYTNGDRGREIHLKGYFPTDKINDEYFGTFDDASHGILSYQNKRGLPWALLIPERFAYPQEGIQLWDSYEKFNGWTRNYGRQEKTWFRRSNGKLDRVVDN